MKKLFHVLLLGGAMAAHAADVPARSGTWDMNEPVYGEVRAVPSVVKDEIPVRSWAGPVKPFRKFYLEVESSPLKKGDPSPYETVLPVIFLRGESEVTVEGTSFPIFLFDGPAKAGDIVVDFTPLRTQPRLGAEFKAATVWSRISDIRWDILVRFTDKKPAK